MSGVLLTGFWLITTSLAAVAGLAVYAAPTIVAFVRRAPDTALIAVINIVFGWTAIAWVIALVLAFRSHEGRAAQVTVIQNAAAAAPPTAPPAAPPAGPPGGPPGGVVQPLPVALPVAPGRPGPPGWSAAPDGTYGGADAPMAGHSPAAWPAEQHRRDRRAGDGDPPPAPDSPPAPDPPPSPPAPPPHNPS